MFEAERDLEQSVRVPLARGSFEYSLEKQADAAKATRIGAMSFVSPNGEHVPLQPLLEEDMRVVLTDNPLITGGALRLGTAERPCQIEMRSLTTHLDTAIFLHELFHAHQLQRPVLAKLTQYVMAFSRACALGASPRLLLRQAEEVSRCVPALRGPFASARERAQALYEGNLRRDDLLLEMVDGRLAALEAGFQAAAEQSRQTREALGETLRRGFGLKIDQPCRAVLQDNLGEDGLLTTMRLRPGSWSVRISAAGGGLEARNGAVVSSWEPDEGQRRVIAELTARLRRAENRIDAVQEEREDVETAFASELDRRRALIGPDGEPAYRQPEDAAGDPMKPWALGQVVQAGRQVLERDATNRALAFMRWLEREHDIVFDRDGSTHRRMLSGALASYSATARELYACHGTIPQAVDDLASANEVLSSEAGLRMG